MGWHPHPTEIESIADENTLKIKFSDDVEIDYDTRILRGYCPCALCQGHRPRPLDWNRPQSKQAVVVEDISQVGNYAMCIAWGDGHNKGIYSWEFLRQVEETPEEIFDEYPPELPEFED